MSDVALRVENLSGGYGDLVVLRDVGFEIRSGQILGLIGRNGAGKTTTLRMIAGLNELRTGSVHIAGARVDEVPSYGRLKHGLGYVQEGKRIFRSITVEDNLTLGAYRLGLSRAERKRAVDDAVARFPILASKRKAPAGVLSGGQQQILAIAQALMGRPSVLLLDEPSTGLAPLIVSDVLEVVSRLRDEGLAVLLVEQAVEFAVSVADVVTVLDVGRTTYLGPPDGGELSEAVDAAYLGGRKDMPEDAAS